jgi:hypothetical protein
MRIVSRVPGDVRAWLRRLEQAGRWAKNVTAILGRLFEEHFRLEPDTEDQELLPVLRDRRVASTAEVVPQPSTLNPRPSGLALLRPRREAVFLERAPLERAVWRLSRVGPPAPAAAPRVTVPAADADDAPLTLAAESVESLEGEAHFDLSMQMLDSAAERYRVRLACCHAGRELRQVVLVQYRLSRLAPPLRAAPEQAR